MTYSITFTDDADGYMEYYDEVEVQGSWIRCYDNPEDENGIDNEFYYPSHRIQDVRREDE